MTLNGCKEVERASLKPCQDARTKGADNEMNRPRTRTVCPDGEHEEVGQHRGREEEHGQVGRGREAVARAERPDVDHQQLRLGRQHVEHEEN